MFSNSNNNKPGGLFGSSLPLASQPQQAGGLFSTTTTQPQQQQTGGLFSNTTQQPQTSSLFGSTAQKPAGGLFSNPQPAQSGGLFSNAQPTQSGGLFSNTQPTQTSGLFGNASNAAGGGGGGGGLFGGSTNIGGGGGGLFSNTQQQQKAPDNALAQSFLAGSSAAPLPRLGQSQWMNQPSPREKPLQEQMRDTLYAWHPSSITSPFQHYFYTHVGTDRAPYFGVPENEDPVKWEEALKNKPVDGVIPVLARGFGEGGIAGRINIQRAAVQALSDRVREIDNSLGQRIEDHDLKFTLRTQEARRRHVALSRRCLALATKVQVLRNRGYALDASEEELKTKLAKLEQATFDPVMGGRQEELWARMTVVRERARVLREETERLGKAAGKVEESGGLDDEVAAKVRQILTDYDSQLAHLRKELDMIKKEFDDFNNARGQDGKR